MESHYINKAFSYIKIWQVTHRIIPVGRPLALAHSTPMSQAFLEQTPQTCSIRNQSPIHVVVIFGDGSLNCNTRKLKKKNISTKILAAQIILIILKVQ